MRMQIIIVISAFIIFCNCASTKLKLELDLYKEDPSTLVALTPAKTASFLEGLNMAEAETNSLTQDRTVIANELFNTYKAIYAITTKVTTGKDYDPTELKASKGYLDEYKEKLLKKANGVKAEISFARNKLLAYKQILEKSATDSESLTTDAEILGAQINLMESANAVTDSLRKLGGPLKTNFEATFIGLWPKIASSISEENLKNYLDNNKEGKKEFEELRLSVNQLARKLEELNSKGYENVQNISLKLKESVKVEMEPGKLKESIDAVASVATEVPLSIGLGDRGMTSLNELTRSSSLLYSQIDRLQDPADPVWRIVTASENESKWNEEFSETYFLAEGNSSVILVRDTPISFRIQQGKNNPAALIQGQLQVSRAVAQAAISIAGASTGIPLSEIAEPGKKTDDAVEKSQLSESEELARTKAAVERKGIVRMQAIKNLRQNLLLLRDTYQNEDRQKFLSRLQSMLKAHKEFFKPGS